MIIDITKPLVAGMEVYSGHEAFAVKQTRSVRADGYNLSHFSMGAHCGTHIDAPAHFLEDGPTIDQMPLTLMTGPVTVVEAGDGRGFDDLAEDVERLIIKSWGYSGVTGDEVQTLVRKGVRLVGTDRLSIAQDGHDAEVHKLLLGAGVWIVENLALENVLPGEYGIRCMPMNLFGCEGAPARVLLLDGEGEKQ